jgi:DNA-binding transcriptional LysR family regulator
MRLCNAAWSRLVRSTQQSRTVVPMRGVMNGMELRHLRYFVTVAEELHFGRAATRLAIVQPSLSQQIRQLEDELGFPLLYRTKRYVELTDAGKVFLVEARQVLAQVREAKHTAQRAYRGEVGRLVVGYISSSTYDLLPLMLRVYRERFPAVEVALRELTTQEQLRALEEEYIQVGLLRLPISAPLLHVEVVRREPIVCVLPEEHPLATDRGVAAGTRAVCAPGEPTRSRLLCAVAAAVPVLWLQSQCDPGSHRDAYDCESGRGRDGGLPGSSLSPKHSQSRSGISRVGGNGDTDGDGGGLATRYTLSAGAKLPVGGERNRYTLNVISRNR